MPVADSKLMPPRKPSGQKGKAVAGGPLAQAIARKRILIVDDHPMTRAGIAQLLGSQPDCMIAAEAGNPEQAMLELSKRIPDLMLTDITMPGRSGVEFIKDALALYPSLAILVVSMHDELMYAERALRAGARGYIMKEAGGEKLLTAVRQVLAGRVYVSERMSATLLDAMTGRRASSSPIETLSDREFEVFQLIGQGRSTRDIAAQLHLSSKTVDVHRAHIKEKLELKDGTALVRHAVRWVEMQGSQNKEGG
jgi:DNA-binding NarL/FixJ family response regulator